MAKQLSIRSTAKPGCIRTEQPSRNIAIPRGIGLEQPSGPSNAKAGVIEVLGHESTRGTTKRQVTTEQ